MNARTFAKYLRRNPVSRPCGAGYSRAAVIPAYDEEAELPHTLDTLAEALRNAPRPVAVIVVVNHPPGTSEKSSLAVLRHLSGRSDIPGLEWLYAPELSGGVGAARKLGMDAFVSAQTAADADDTLIFSLDADTRIAKNYFSVLEDAFLKHPEAGFATVGFRHETGATPELEHAIREYEAYLRDYAAGLRRAGSPYAFTSIGSAFAVRGSVYIRSGGMKTRSAGEDFYFLQQCAKCGGLFEVAETLVFPSARRSGRNPFGTGPALENLLAGKPLRRTPPEAFELLKFLLAAADTSTLDTPDGLPAAVPRTARDFLIGEKFPKVWRKILANTPPAARRRAFDCWFDGLRTLRFLHSVSGTDGTRKRPD